VAVVTAANTLYESSDGGQRWTQISIQQMPVGADSFHFFDSQHAWVQVFTALVHIQDPEQVVRYASTLLFTRTEAFTG